MTLDEVVTVTKANLQVVETRSDAHFASLRGFEIKKDGILEEASGRGATPGEALANLAKKISNNIIVQNAYGGESRREFPLPDIDLF